MSRSQTTFTLPISSARLRGPSVRQPREFACFSYDGERRLRFDDSALAYFYLPPDDVSGGIDLSGGFGSFRKRDEHLDEHLDGLLLALARHERATGKKTAADIVTWRGILAKLLCVPYSKNDGFELNATWFDGHLFIEENLPYKLATQRPQDQRGALMSYWGYKFEQVATLPKPWHACSRAEIETRGSKPVSNLSQYISVVKTGLAGVRLVIAGEVDCVRDYKPDSADAADNPLDHYVELKTSKVISSDRDAAAFEAKLLRIWAQSFLLGVPTAVVGFRTEQGFVQTLEEFETQKIPGIVKKSRRAPWDGMDALAFLAACLEWLKASIPHRENVVWRIRYLPRSDFLLLVQTDEPSFLHPDFVDWRLQQRSDIQ